MSYLRDKRILLTGAAGGFGAIFVRRLLDKGAALVVSDLDENLEAIGSRTPAGTPGRILGAIGADLATPEGCRHLYAQCRKTAGTIDIVIHNAGILVYGCYQDVPIERVYRLIQVNTLSPMHLSALFLPEMIARGSGHLVFVSSVAGFVPTAFEAAYSASKCALRGFGMALSGELAGSGVSVTNIYPFWADTKILNSDSYGKKQAKRVPSFLVDSPEKVVSEAIRGIEKRKRHVYPGFFAKAVWQLTRLHPIVGRQPVADLIETKSSAAKGGVS